MLIDVSPLRKSREYRLLYTGQTVSFFGSMLTYLAVPYQVYQLTHSSLWVGLLGTVQLIPLLVAALVGGAYADAVDRRRMLVLSELALTVCSALLAVNSALSHPTSVLVFAMAAAMSAINGLIIAKVGLPAVFIIDVASFGVSLACLAAMRPLPRKAPGAKSPLGSIAEGLRYARSRPELIGTYVVDIVAMIFAMPMALFPVMGERWSGATSAGWLYSSMPIGSLVMTLFSGWTSSVRRHGAAVVFAASIWGIAVVALGFASSLPVAVACLAIAGAADMVSGIFRQTIWNQTIPHDLRG
jgi:hypothetical protein